MKLSNYDFKTKIYLFIGTVIFVSLFRYLPHPPNFTPVIALTFYSAVFFGLPSSVFVILAFAISDIFIGLHNLLFFTWGGLALISLLSKISSNFFSRMMLLVLSSIIFFIVSNFGVWLLSNFYPKNFDGLFKCYLLAIPFFSNTFVSTLIFGLLFEIFKMGKIKIRMFDHK